MPLSQLSCPFQITSKDTIGKLKRKICVSPPSIMIRVLMIAFSWIASSTALHDWSKTIVKTDGGCVAPGTCTAPVTKYSRRIIGPAPGQQWNINGGFCGAFSVQQAALSTGAWISQDYVRKANRDFQGAKVMHGTKDLYVAFPPRSTSNDRRRVSSLIESGATKSCRPTLHGQRID